MTRNIPRGPSPFSDPHGLWSLWDMLGRYAAVYVMVIETLDNMISGLAEVAALSAPKSGVEKVTLTMLGKEPRLDKGASSAVSLAMTSIVEQLSSRMAHPSVVAQSKRILKAIEKGEGAAAVADKVRELRTRLIDELSEMQFLYISPDRVPLYQEPMLFGKEVNDRLPQAIDDIEEAGKCLALGQGTACVLHTMRILEVGLKALAGALKIPYAPSWESYLSQISSNIAKKHATKTKAWKKDEKFFRDLSGDLLIIKQVFRNPTMHVDRKYSVEEADQIFAAAKTFMTRLAEHFTQKALEKMLK